MGEDEGTNQQKKRAEEKIRKKREAEGREGRRQKQRD